MRKKKKDSIKVTPKEGRKIKNKKFPSEFHSKNSGMFSYFKNLVVFLTIILENPSMISKDKIMEDGSKVSVPEISHQMSIESHKRK